MLQCMPDSSLALWLASKMAAEADDVELPSCGCGLFAWLRLGMRTGAKYIC
jgi:hypothetical protein